MCYFVILIFLMNIEWLFDKLYFLMKRFVNPQMRFIIVKFDSIKGAKFIHLFLSIKIYNHLRLSDSNFYYIWILSSKTNNPSRTDNKAMNKKEDNFLMNSQCQKKTHFKICNSQARFNSLSSKIRNQIMMMNKIYLILGKWWNYPRSRRRKTKN